MLEEATVVYSEPEKSSTTHIVYAMAQFLLAARHRKNVVFTAFAVAGLLGGLYYFTATPYYDASASILVMGSGADGTSISGPLERGQQRNSMPTFESLFSKAKVLSRAIPLLRPEDCIDFGQAPVEAWPAILGASLSTQVLRGTNIIEISYRSKDPKVAVAVVNAVVESYRAFLDETHAGTTGRVSRLFKQEQVQTKENLEKAQRELETMLARYEIFGLATQSDKENLHPKMQSVLFFHKAWLEAYSERLGLEASLQTIREAIHNGQSLQQQALALAEAAGMELLLTKLGINKYNAYFLAEIERGLLEARAELTAMTEVYGSAHPDVIVKTNEIREAQEYLRRYQQDANRRVDQIQRSELGPMLTLLVEQKLREVYQRETALRSQYERARAEAIALNGQLARVDGLKHDVEWLRKEHDALLDKIADITLLEDGQEVHTEVVQDPVEAGNPVSPNLKRVILMVLIGGLALGLVLVYVLDILDDRFRSVEEIESRLKVPVLAMVRQLKTSEVGGLGGLQMHVEPGSVQCEAFRTLRTALELADDEARQIVISSARMPSSRKRPC